MAEHDGFLGRWSQRKAMARQGLVPDAAQPAEPSAPAPMPAPEAPPVQAHQPRPAQGLGPEVASLPSAAAAEPQPAAPLTLEDVASLTPQDDFSPFVTRSVAPEVRNAAMKKLFADPTFNVMDGLDIYIDDYSRPDPLPASLARRLLQAQWPSAATAADDAAPAPATEKIHDPVDIPDESAPAPEPAPPAGPPLASALPSTHDPMRAEQPLSPLANGPVPPVPVEPKP